MRNEPINERLTMKKTTAFLVALLLSTASGALWAGDGVPEASFDRKKVGASDGTIDPEVVTSLIDRLVAAGTRGDLSALSAVDKELKTWMGSLVRAHRPARLESATRTAKEPTKKVTSTKKLDPAARQILFRTAFELRAFYGRHDRFSQSEKRRLLLRLTKL